jgi:hypothetical protein
MHLLNHLRRLLPMPEIFLMYEPSREVSAIYLKLPLWSGLSLIASVALDHHLRLTLQFQLTTKLAEDFTLTGPTHSINLM